MEAFSDYWIGGQRISKNEWAIIRTSLTEDQVAEILAKAAKDLSTGEATEFAKKFK
jgi:hypothetical protein